MIIPIANILKPTSARINVIRDQLDDNNYTVDIQQVASKLIDLEIALTGPPKKQVA